MANLDCEWNHLEDTHLGVPVRINWGGRPTLRVGSTFQQVAQIEEVQEKAVLSACSPSFLRAFALLPLLQTEADWIPAALQESSRSSVTGTVEASWTEETAIISLLLGPADGLLKCYGESHPTNLLLQCVHILLFPFSQVTRGWTMRGRLQVWKEQCLLGPPFGTSLLKSLPALSRSYATVWSESYRTLAVLKASSFHFFF